MKSFKASLIPLCLSFFMHLSAEPVLHMSAEPALHVCTVANYQCDNLDYLLTSGRHFGIEVKVIGLDRPFPNNFTKLYRMQEYLRTLPPNDIVLFIDAFDVLLLGDAPTILSRYYEFETPCLFSAERRLYPRSSIKDLKIPYPKAETSFIYLNSGGYIGRVAHVQWMINEIIADRYTIPWRRFRRLRSDQFHCHRFFVQNPHLIKLDHHNKIFLTLSDVQREELRISIDKKEVFVKETGGYPLVIHGNGPGKFLYESMSRAFFYGQSTL